MSIFGRIFPIKDILARVPQLEAQVEKLEKEDVFSRNSKNRSSFRKRCAELNKQIENQQLRISNLKVKEGSEDRRLAEQAMENLKEIQDRLSHIAPIMSAETSVVEEKSNEETHVVTAPIQAVKRDDTSSPSPVPDPAPAPPPANPPTRYPGNRRPSMYDDINSDEDNNDDEEVAVMVVEPPPKPKPQPRTIAVKSSSVERREEKEKKSEVQAPNVVEKKPSVIVEEDDELHAIPPSHSQAAPLRVVDGNKFLALADFKEQESGDLTIKKGEILTITQTRPDGWWTAVNSENRTGLVPKTFLRHLPPEEFRQTQVSTIQAIPVFPTSKEKDSEVSAEEQHLTPIDMGKPKHIDGQADLPPPSTTAVQPLVMAITRPVRCMGDAVRTDPHLSYACHLTPRLSHSNLAFHDLYWNYEDDKIRKRHVRVSCLLRLVHLENMPKDAEVGLIRAALYDTSRKTGRQLVSNVHTIKAQIKGTSWSFITRADTVPSGVEFGDFILRSNYKMKEVILLLEASTIQNIDGVAYEKSLGSCRLPIIGDNYECCLTRKTYNEFLTTENIFDTNIPLRRTAHKLVMKVLDVPKDLAPFVDSLPDVLLFNPIYVRIAYFYRRRAGTLLLRDRSNPLSAEMISDPLLSIFPYVADQPDLMDLVRTLWNTRYRIVKNQSEVLQAQSFFQVFMNTAYCIYRTAVMPDYCVWDKKVLAERQEVFKKCVDMLREYKTSARFLLTTTSKPINIYDYSLDVMGIHALD